MAQARASNKIVSPYEHWTSLTDARFFAAMSDFEKFCAESLINDKNGVPVPFILNEAQKLVAKEILKAIIPILEKKPCPSIRILCHKSRQMGITTLMLKLEQFILSKTTNFNALHIMPTESEAGEMIDRKMMPLLYGTNPDLLADMSASGNRVDFIEFDGNLLDNRLTFISSLVKSGGHGRTIHLLVEDEHCLGGGTRVLTDRGMIPIEDVTIEDKVAQWDAGEIDFVHPSETYRYDNPKDVYELTVHNGRKVVMTGAHRNILLDRLKGEYFERRLDEMTQDSRFSIPVAGTGYGDNSSLTTMEKILIAAQADGSVSRRNTIRKNTTYIKFGLKLERKIIRLKQYLEDAGIRYNINSYSNGFTDICFSLDGQVDIKTLPFSFSMGKDRALEIIDEMVFWDGSLEKGGNPYYSSICEHNVQLFAAAGTQSGHNVWLSSQDDGNKNHNIVHRCRLTRKSARSTQGFTREKIEYDKPVFCLTVPSGAFIAEFGNTLYVTGNSKYQDPFSLEAGILPAMSGNTVRIVLFTAKGMNHSYDLSKTAQDPESDWVYIFLPWYILEEYEANPKGKYKDLTDLTEYDVFLCNEFEKAGVPVDKWARKLQWYNSTLINEAKRDTQYMYENYPTVAAESFQASGAPIFDSVKLYEWMDTPHKRVDVFYEGGENVFRYTDDGAIKELEPPKRNHSYIIGIDPADGEVRGDDSAVVVWDITSEKIKAVAAYNGTISQNDLADLCYDLAMRYNQALLVPERNMGQLMIKWLVEVKGYMNIWTDTATVNTYNVLGVRTTIPSKNEMVARMKFLINNGYYEDFDPEFCEQGIYFTYVKTQGGQFRAAADAGHKDDSVFARLLCTMALDMGVYKSYHESIVKEGKKYG